MYDLYYDRNFIKVEYIKNTIISIEKFLLQNKNNKIQKNNNQLFIKKNIFSILWSSYCKFKSNTNFRLTIKNNYKNVIFFETGFINRNKYRSININNMFGLSDFIPINCPSDRLEKLNIKLKPYNEMNYNEDKYILITGQLPWDTQVQDINYNKWLNSIFLELKQKTDRKIVFRHHPLYKNINNPKFIINIPDFIKIDKNKDINYTFKDTFCLVSYNSNSFIEAVIEGIPIFVFNKMSLVYDLGYHNLDNINQPYIPIEEKRQQVLSNISYMQWSLNEIENGEMINYLEKNYYDLWLYKEIEKLKSISINLEKSRYKHFTLNNILQNNQFINCMEFGVFKGTTINLISDFCDKVYGFDSFEGLPESWNGVCEKNTFKISELPKVKDNVILIKGLFQDTLEKFIIEKKELEINMIHIDCDLYSSTKFVFDMLIKYNILKKGLIIIFDEIINYNTFYEGEMKALFEICKNHNLQFKWLGTRGNVLHKNEIKGSKLSFKQLRNLGYQQEAAIIIL